jgi:putative transposase
MDTLDLAEDYLIDRNEGMKKLITWFLNQVMQQEALNQIQAQPYERTGRRKARRNGMRKRTLKTLHGEVILDKPQFREFPFHSLVFDRYSRVEKSLRIAIAESYLQGVSTRRVREIVSKFGLETISASEVSRIAKELDEKVKEFLERPIEEEIRYLFMDASYFKVRSDGRYVNKALLTVTGIREDGYREILGAKVADSEDEAIAELKESKLRIYFNNHARAKSVRNAFLLTDMLLIEHMQKEDKMLDQFTLGESKLLSGATEE